jgi:ketosteroid isomerase-like protein
MSQENVEAVRRMVEGFAAFREGNPDAMADVVAVLDPSIEWHGTVGGLDEDSVARGYEEVARRFAESFEPWEQHLLEAERYIDAGHAVVVFWHEIARSRHTAQQLEMRTAAIYSLRDGRVVEARAYLDRAEALEAAGLSE